MKELQKLRNKFYVRELSKIVHISPNTIINIEKKLVKPNKRQRSKILHAYEKYYTLLNNPISTWEQELDYLVVRYHYKELSRMLGRGIVSICKWYCKKAIPSKTSQQNIKQTYEKVKKQEE